MRTANARRWSISVNQVVQRIDQFIAAHNVDCQPFKWPPPLIRASRKPDSTLRITAGRNTRGTSLVSWNTQPSSTHRRSRDECGFLAATRAMANSPAAGASVTWHGTTLAAWILLPSDVSEVLMVRAAYCYAYCNPASSFLHPRRCRGRRSSPTGMVNQLQRDAHSLLRYFLLVMDCESYRLSPVRGTPPE